MPIAPLSITLTDGQKVEALKRFREQYAEELAKLDAELSDVLTRLAEADFLAGYLGEQPEVAALRAQKDNVEKLERRRQHIGKLIERLDQVLPKQADVKLSLGGTPARGAAPPPAAPPGGGLRRY